MYITELQHESADAKNIKALIDQQLKAMNINLKTQLVGASADGASVNFGSETGVLTQFKSEQPSLVTIHCTTHRLELALKDAFKGTYFSEVHLIKYYFNCSAFKYNLPIIHLLIGL